MPVFYPTIIIKKTLSEQLDYIKQYNETEDYLIISKDTIPDLLLQKLSIYRIIDNIHNNIQNNNNDNWNIILLKNIIFNDINYSDLCEPYIINIKNKNNIHNKNITHNKLEYDCSQISNHTNKNIPFFSIVLPIYNGMNYIKEAIHSIFKQTFNDYELIIVNDGSTDDTKLYLDELKTTDNLIDNRIYVLHQHNQKTANAINNGLKRCRGKYITWTSHDNVLDYNFLEEFHKVLAQHNNIHFIYAGCRYFGSYFWPSNHGLLTSRSLFFAYPGIASFVWSRDTIDKVGLYDIELNGIDDLDYVWRTIEYKPHVYAIKKMLYWFRVHEAQATEELSRNNKWDSLKEKLLIKFLKRNNENSIHTNIHTSILHSFYPYIEYCKNKNRAYCIAYYDLGIYIVNDDRYIYRNTLLPLAINCFKKSYEYDNTFIESKNIYNELLNINDTNNANNMNKKYKLLDIHNEELFLIEKEHMKQHEYC